MCHRCDNKAVTKKWTIWLSVSVAMLIFILSQVFMYGKVIGIVETHIANDPTYEQLSEKFVEQSEFDTVKDMILYLYKQQGGK